MELLHVDAGSTDESNAVWVDEFSAMKRAWSSCSANDIYLCLCQDKMADVLLFQVHHMR